MPELLAPAGSFENLAAAIQAGCDSVYFGIRGINMRSGAKADFTLENMGEVVKQCHEKNVCAYLTLNTIIYENEYDLIRTILDKAQETGVDAIIAWDHFVLAECQRRGMECHLSTQASVANFEALKSYYQKYGIKRFVLARELDLPQITRIIERIKEEKLPLEIETFIHGAMCISVSGRCFMSQVAHCKSANRGECVQPCRRSYLVKDAEEGTEYLLENSFVMSPKDLCTMPIIGSLIESGIAVFKIEGRARAPEYVKCVVESYRKAIELHKEGALTDEKKKDLITRMERVYNKGFETGFYLGKPLDAWAGAYGSKATTQKVKLGKVTNYFKQAGAAEIKMEEGELSVGDEYYIIGPTTGVIESTASLLMIANQSVKKVVLGQTLTLRTSLCRKGDVLYKIIGTSQHQPCHSILG